MPVFESADVLFAALQKWGELPFCFCVETYGMTTEQIQYIFDHWCEGSDFYKSPQEFDPSDPVKRLICCSSTDDPANVKVTDWIRKNLFRFNIKNCRSKCRWLVYDFKVLHPDALRICNRWESDEN